MAREVSESKLTIIRNLGYAGQSTLEDLMIPLNNFMFSTGRKYIKGQIWWIILKDAVGNRNRDFADVVIDRLETYLKYGN